MSFQEITGQERAIRILQEALKTGHLAHAYLFFGEEGIGKGTVARYFAKAINCEKGEGDHPPPDACDLCPSCRKIEREIHPDVVVVRPEGNQIKVEQVRSIQELMVYKPFSGRKKIYIIEGAEKMNETAATAALKTIEEPPPETLLILITSQPYTLPLTLVSRSIRIQFSPLPFSQAVRFLMEKRGLTDSQARTIALHSQGRIGKALLLDPVRIEKERDRFSASLSRSVEGDLSALFETAQTLSKDQEEMEKTLTWCALFLRDLLLLRVSGGASPRALPDLSIQDILTLFALLVKIWRAQSRNVNRRLSIEVLLLELRKRDKRGKGQKEG